MSTATRSIKMPINNKNNNTSCNDENKTSNPNQGTIFSVP